ncbi:uncharacterized protein LOC100212733 isoform X2 [Hydra vulgaris]|uniref:Uncharacterized protein LOC100212733 isoform X2 n=1 Tax=Hydra vulgaris TaxID=6087 RepID=A0ABM4C5Y2_HYDVU
MKTFFIALYSFLLCKNFMANELELSLTPSESLNDLLQKSYELNKNVENVSLFETYDKVLSLYYSNFLSQTTTQDLSFEEQTNQAFANDSIYFLEVTNITLTSIRQNSTDIFQTSTTDSMLVEMFSSEIPKENSTLINVYDSISLIWSNVESQATFSNYTSMPGIELDSSLVPGFASTLSQSVTEFLFTNENNTNIVYETADVTPSFSLISQSIYYSIESFETAIKEVETSLVITLSNYNSDISDVDNYKTNPTTNINFSTPVPTWFNTNYVYNNISSKINFNQFSENASLLTLAQNVTKNESDFDVKTTIYKPIIYSLFSCDIYNFTGYNISEYNMTWNRKCVDEGDKIPWYKNPIIYYIGGGSITGLIVLFILKSLCSICNKYSGEYIPPRHKLPPRRRNKEAWVLRHIDRFPNKSVTT